MSDGRPGKGRVEVREGLTVAKRFVDKKTHRFYFRGADGRRHSFVLIYGDEVDAGNNTGPSGPGFTKVGYRGREGEWKEPPLTTDRSLEIYFLDVGQGDAGFVVTPDDVKILVDGGLHDRALGFLIWKYRLDVPGPEVTIDHLFLSHADKDHVEGLIPLLRHPRIRVLNIHHNGIGIFDSGFDTPLGNRSADGALLTTLHDTTSDLAGLDLASSGRAAFGKWIEAVEDSGAAYHRLDRSHGTLDVGDPNVTVEIIGPALEPGGGSARWFGDRSHTINGQSLVFRLTYDGVRTFFSGDLNIPGSRHLLEQPNAALGVNAHILKAPHHGSHEFSEDLFSAVNPMLTVVSSGESPDHGHPRANFLAAVGRASRGERPLLFSTEVAALFTDVDEPAADAETRTTLGDLDFTESDANTEARKRFKKVLPGIINVRTNGREIYAYRRVQQSYQWESYGPITPFH